jgi:hypothetical protein
MGAYDVMVYVEPNKYTDSFLSKIQDTVDPQADFVEHGYSNAYITVNPRKERMLIQKIKELGFEWRVRGKIYTVYVNQKTAAKEVKTVIRNGFEYLAKENYGDLFPMTFANRSQAEKAVSKLSDDWYVVQRGRPFMVIRPAGSSKTAAKEFDGEIPTIRRLMKQFGFNYGGIFVKDRDFDVLEFSRVSQNNVNPMESWMCHVTLFKNWQVMIQLWPYTWTAPTLNSSMLGPVDNENDFTTLMKKAIRKAKTNTIFQKYPDAWGQK